MDNAPIRVFIGWDRDQANAYDVCRFSIQQRASVKIEIQPLILDQLRASGVYYRPPDPLASTEFTYSRFLVPYLCHYEGFALFCDCDFLWLDDIGKLWRYADESKALCCVKQDYGPPEQTKMDGKLQTRYPRKNWSSLMLFNCSHAANQVLVPECVNIKPGSYLHQFKWVEDELIGAIDPDWNWLEGWSKYENSKPPRAVHFTRGGPWLEDWAHVDYAEEWFKERDRMFASLTEQP